NSYLIQIKYIYTNNLNNSNANFNQYHDEILELLNNAYNMSVNYFEPYTAENNNDEAIVWIIKYKKTNEIVGITVTSDLDQFKSIWTDDIFGAFGGIPNKKGLFISTVA